MLTVKHVEGHNINIYEADSVHYLPEDDICPEQVRAYHHGTKQGRAIATGFVYVMNEAGKTVEKYDFSKGPMGVEAVTARKELSVS